VIPASAPQALTNIGDNIEVRQREEITAEMTSILAQQSTRLSSSAKFAEMSDEELSLYIRRTERLRQLSKELSDLSDFRAA
jgi:hypothetical protein